MVAHGSLQETEAAAALPTQVLPTVLRPSPQPPTTSLVPAVKCFVMICTVSQTSFQ